MVVETAQSKSMKVLIIGAKGMLGQALATVFNPGNEVISWDRDEIDITQVESIKLKVKSEKPELLINAAAYTDVDSAETNSELANKINGHGVGYLADAAKELNVPIVHFSTEYVFDGEKREGYLESDQPVPISVYGSSKLLGEQELARNTDKFYLIRLSRLFGSAGNGKKSFIQTMLDLAASKKEIDAVDEELSCPTYAADAAAAGREIVEKKLPFGI